MKFDKIVDIASKQLGSHFENYIKYLEIYQKPGEILEKSWNFVILENWEPFIVQCVNCCGVHLLTVLLLHLFSVEGIE